MWDLLTDFRGFWLPFIVLMVVYAWAKAVWEKLNDIHLAILESEIRK